MKKYYIEPAFTLVLKQYTSKLWMYIIRFLFNIIFQNADNIQ